MGDIGTQGRGPQAVPGVEHATARRLRDLVEPIAAAVYFAPEAQREYAALGLDFLEGYFCSRSACLGAAPGSVVTAVFAAFNPAIVEPAVRAGWSKTTPERVLEARAAGATAQLTRLLGDVASASDLERAASLLFSLTDGLDRSGRPLFAGLSALDRPADPFGALWRAADLVREHRGDGHIGAWIGHLDSCEMTALTELYWGIPPRSYIVTRGWGPHEVDAAYERLQARALVDGTTLTPAGRELRERIEQDTDRAAREPVQRLADRAPELFALLEPWAAAIVEGGGYPVDPASLRGSLPI